MTGLTVVIVTYRREEVLLQTLDAVLALDPAAAEVLVVDQTETHAESTDSRLAELHDGGRIRWLRLDRPSIPHAMNVGLREAGQPIVLFLDDDLVPDRRLVHAHAEAHLDAGIGLVTGRVIQPWHRPDAEPLTSRRSTECDAEKVMGGNLSVAREVALEAGGFDENFVRVAYRFEAEFAERIQETGRRLLFEPRAVVHHLKAARGGTRTFGEHFRTVRAGHSVGAYYYLLRSRRVRRRGWRIVQRWVGSVTTKYHLRRPWWIPLTLVAESAGLAWAVAQAVRGPKLIASDPKATDRHA